uniref:C-reactive protein n=1 Tax=Anser brachyrhynchus TaxID=132585 RepID=A0A8B9CID9_9AVES
MLLPSHPRQPINPWAPAPTAAPSTMGRLRLWLAVLAGLSGVTAQEGRGTSGGPGLAPGCRAGSGEPWGVGTWGGGQPRGSHPDPHPWGHRGGSAPSDAPSHLWEPSALCQWGWGMLEHQRHGGDISQGGRLGGHHVPSVTPPPDLYRKVFVFRTDPSDAYVVLRAKPEQPLLNFTVCLRSYTDLTRPHSLFSYATKAQDNEILLFKPKPTEYRFYVGGKFVTFRVPEGRGDWEHVCASWESATGIAEFWLNGKPWPRKGLQKDYVVGADAVITLGQEQDAFGGGFDVYNSFTGELADVHLWDAGLSPDKMRAAYQSLRLPPALLAWRSLSYETKGDVVVKPRLREALGR